MECEWVRGDVTVNLTLLAARRMCKQEALAKFQTMETKQKTESSQIMDQKLPYIVARNTSLLF